MYNDRILPFDLDSEEAVLGSCFIDFEAIAKVADFLLPGDFYREKNQWTFEAMLKLYKEGKPTNQIIVAHELAKTKKLEAVGGAPYISHCISQTPTSVHVRYYAEIVKDCSARRKLIRESHRNINKAYDETKPLRKRGGINLGVNNICDAR